MVKFNQKEIITIWYNMIWYDTIWYDTIWYDTIWYDKIWYDTIRSDIIWYNTILTLESKSMPNCCPNLLELPKINYVPFEACCWTKWVQTWHVGTWRVNLPSVWEFWTCLRSLLEVQMGFVSKKWLWSQRIWTWKLPWSFELEID